MDEINKRYIFSRLINLNIKFELLKSDKFIKERVCKIILDNGFFKVLNY